MIRIWSPMPSTVTDSWRITPRLSKIGRFTGVHVTVRGFMGTFWSWSSTLMTRRRYACPGFHSSALQRNPFTIAFAEHCLHLDNYICATSKYQSVVRVTPLHNLRHHDDLDWMHRSWTWCVLILGRWRNGNRGELDLGSCILVALDPNQV